MDSTRHRYLCFIWGHPRALYFVFNGQSTIVQIETTGSEFLWGLFGGGTEIKFVELQGYLMVPEVRQTLTAIIGFYFGNASAKVS